MKKAFVGTLAAVALVVAALVLGPTLWAQGRGREVTTGIERLLAQGPGSEFGVSIRELRSDEVSATLASGVFVENVRGGSPAERAGLRTGDVFVELDGERVRSTRQFVRLVRETPPGRAVSGTIVRDGARQTVEIVPEASRRMSMVLPDVRREIERGLRAIPRDFDLDLSVRRGRGDARLGAELSPLSDQLASYFGVEEGVLVSAVEAGSPAEQAGMRAGDVITAIGGRDVADPGDAVSAVRRAMPGAILEIQIVRDKQQMTLSATLPDRRPVIEPRIPA